MTRETAMAELTAMKEIFEDEQSEAIETALKYLEGIPTAHYSIPQKCPVCGQSDFWISVAYRSGIVGCYCRECGWFKNIPKNENLAKRTNTPLAIWSSTVRHKYGKCFICGETEGLEAHHIIPVSHSEKFKYEPSNGIALCKRCHLLVHHKEVEK